MRAGALVNVAVSLWLVVPAAAWAAAERPEIVIEVGRLDPPALRTTSEQRVTFVNRSGHIVHVDFLGDGGQHHVYQVPGSIWAVFHRPGRHPYVVHFQTGRQRDLHGVVEVEPEPAATAPAPTCAGITVMGACLEP